MSHEEKSTPTIDIHFGGEEVPSFDVTHENERRRLAVEASQSLVFVAGEDLRAGTLVTIGQNGKLHPVSVDGEPYHLGRNGELLRGPRTA